MTGVSEVSHITARDALNATGVGTFSITVQAGGGVVPLDPTINTFRLTNVSGADVSNYPIAFQRAFKDGEIPNTPRMVELSLAFQQWTVLARYASGCVRRAMCHAVVQSLIRSVVADFTFANTTAPQPTGPTVDPSDLNAQIVLERGITTKTADAQTMFRAGFAKKVYDGPIATTFLIRDDSVVRVYDLGFDQYRSCRPTFVATKWHALGKWHVVRHLFNGLGGMLEDVACDQIDMPIESDMYSEAPFVSYWGTWIAREGWIGGAPEEKINFDHNLGWLANQALALGAPYDPWFAQFWTEQKIADKYALWQNAPNKDFNEPGLWPSMSDAEPGTDPPWYLDYLFSRGDWRMRKVMMDQAYRSGCWRINFINGNPALFFDKAGTVPALGKPPSIFSNPLEQLGHSTGSPWSPHDEGIPHPPIMRSWQAAHEPNAQAIPYLLTGDPLLLEACQRSAMCDQLTVPVNKDPTHIPTYPTILRANGVGGYAGPTRGCAWSKGILFSAHYLSTDGTPEKDYLEVIGKARLGVDFGRRGYPSPELQGPAYQYGVLARNSTKGGAVKFSPVGWWQDVNSWSASSGTFFKHDATWVQEPFQNNYMLCVDGKAKDYGWPVQVEIDAISKPMRMFIAECQANPGGVHPEWFGTYIEPLATAIGVNPTAPLYTTRAEAMAEITDSELAGVAMAFTQGGGTYVLKAVAGAAAAFTLNSPEWQWIMANVRNDGRWNFHYPSDPWLCVTPRA